MKNFILCKSFRNAIRNKVHAKLKIEKSTLSEDVASRILHQLGTPDPRLKSAEVSTLEEPALKKYNVAVREYEKMFKPLVRRLPSFTKGYEDKVDINRKVFETFKDLCEVLDVKISIDDSIDIQKQLIDILDILNLKKVITQEQYDEQLIYFQSSDGFSYYACYYSKGLKEPQVAMLRVDANWSGKVILDFFDERSTHEGTITNVGDGANIFLSLTDVNSKFLSLLSLKPNIHGKPQSVKRFFGFFCSALPSKGGDPVAGKLIIEKLTREEVLTLIEQPKKRADFPELIDERLEYGKPHIDLTAHRDLVKCYQGYWLLVKRKIYIRKIKLEILPGGTCRFVNPENREFTGIIKQIDDKVMKLDVDPHKDGYNFRSQWTFDIGQNNGAFLDGVYSGQRNNWGKIMAGKIRLYRQEGPYESMTVGQYAFGDLEELGERGRDLKAFLLGEDTGLRSDSFIQPTMATMKELLYPEENQSNKKTTLGRFATTYHMYRLDSKRHRINIYKLQINPDFSVDYSLIIPEVRKGSKIVSKEEKISYNGTSSLRDGCLYLNINKKADEPYDAMYIFYVSKYDRNHIDIKGVYATIAVEGSPICGRVILKAEVSESDAVPILIDSPEYNKFKEEEPDLADLLTGPENNLIKVNRTPNKLKRKFAYGDLFFSHACHGNLEDSERIQYFKAAFEHGFERVEELRYQLAQNEALVHLKKKMVIAEENKTFTVKVKDDKKVWNVIAKFRSEDVPPERNLDDDGKERV